MKPSRFRSALGRGVLAAASVLAACDVPAPDASTPATWPAAGGADGGGSSELGRALTVLCTDYRSTSLGLLAADGSILSPNLVSSGSGASGLSAPLSGDVALPTQPTEDLVLVDSGNAVLSWVDPGRARVIRQLSVGTGFRANPKDYVALSPTKAYVPRFEPNSDPGREPFDAGDDLLVIDPSVPAITGSIDLKSALGAAADGYHPRPEAVIASGGIARVVLGAYSMDFTSSLESRLVTVDVESDRVTDVLVLDGLHGCAAASLSPDATELAVSCTGDFGGDSVGEASGSGLALVDVKGTPGLVRRLSAAELGGDPLGFGLAYRSSSRLLITTFGRFASGSEPARDDALLELDLGSGELTRLMSSSGMPYTLGALRCETGAGVCFVADAGRGVVHRLADADGDLSAREIRLDDGIGLPPRELGWVGE